MIEILKVVEVANVLKTEHGNYAIVKYLKDLESGRVSRHEYIYADKQNFDDLTSELLFDGYEFAFSNPATETLVFYKKERIEF